MDDEDMDVSVDGVTSKRACDACRARKIRCDRAVPCSNCKASKLTCITSAPAPKAQRQRVHISEEYEKKIDRIEDRLTGIENVLESLASKLGNLDLQRSSPGNSNQSRSSGVETGRSHRASTEPPTPAPFEGETAINSQSDYARELLTQVIGSSPSMGQNEEVKKALSALNELVTRQGQATAPAASGSHSQSDRLLAETDPEKLDRPPWEIVSEVLDKASKFPTMALSVIFPFLNMQLFIDIVHDAYENPGRCGAPRRVLAYGLLFSLLQEFCTTPLATVNRDNYETSMLACKKHVEVAMSQLDILLPATYENIVALLMGATRAIEAGKPSLAWVMTSSAAGLCQHLGYHRYQTMKDDTETERGSKIHLFWLIYMFDRIMSLRLGRASSIQDWDISLPFVIGGTLQQPQGTDGKQMLSYWIKVARVQGQTYEKLFSPAAFLDSSEQRTRTAVELVNAMNQAWYERGDSSVIEFAGVRHKAGLHALNPMIPNNSPNETEIPSRRKHKVAAQQIFTTTADADEYMKKSAQQGEDVLFHSNVVVHYSTCALIQRAVSLDNAAINQECLGSARAALVAHERCNAQFNVPGSKELYSGYIHWSILQAPFTPFIVLFCNAIQNTDSTDLASLQAFVSSLESCRAISEGADKLYKMCHLFLQVAKLYLQAKTQDVQAQAQVHPEPNYYTTADGTQLDLNAMTQFDPYLSALGLMPNSSWPMTGFVSTPGAMKMYTYPQEEGIGGGSAGVLPEVGGSGIGLPGAGQNSVQDWFSGSRYLMNLMEAGDDLQMPDLNF